MYVTTVQHFQHPLLTPICFQPRLWMCLEIASSSPFATCRSSFRSSLFKCHQPQHQASKVRFFVCNFWPRKLSSFFIKLMCAETTTRIDYCCPFLGMCAGLVICFQRHHSCSRQATDDPPWSLCFTHPGFHIAFRFFQWIIIFSNVSYTLHGYPNFNPVMLWVISKFQLDRSTKHSN